MNYPNPCVRCGMCCLSTPCPIALFHAKGAVVNEPCPCLFINEQGVAVCDMITEDNKEIFGVGKGCCISARVIRGGTETQFAGLCEDEKKHIVKILAGRMKGAI